MNPFAELRKNYLIDGVPISMRRLSKEFNFAIKPNHICNLENGRERASIKQMKIYHDFFHASYDYLLGVSLDPQIRPGMPDLEGVDVPDWLRESQNPNDAMIRQMLEELMSTGKGMVLLSYLAELVYTRDSDKTGYCMEEGKLYREEPYDEERELELLVQRIRAYKKISDKARFIEVRERMENMREEKE